MGRVFGSRGSGRLAFERFAARWPVGVLAVDGVVIPGYIGRSRPASPQPEIYEITLYVKE